MFDTNYLRNLFELVFPPQVSRAFIVVLNTIVAQFAAMKGEPMAAVTLVAQTTYSWDAGAAPFLELTTGDENITINAVVTGLIPGQKVTLKFIQGATARTVTWGTNIRSNVTVTATGARTDLLQGIFDGTDIILGADVQNLT